MITRSLTPDTFFEEALPVLEEIIYSRQEKWQDMIPVLANYKPGTGWGTQTTEQTGVGPAIEIAEGSPVTYDDISQGNSKTFTYVKYGIGVKVTEEMIDDDKWDQVGDIYASLPDSMFHTRQTVFFDNFNDGFTTNGYDGVPFFSTAHPLAKAGGTQRNRPSVEADLSVASLRGCYTDIANWLTHEGFKTYYMVDKILVSTTNVYDAYELLKSDYKPGTAQNDVNAFKMFGEKALHYSPYLEDSDAWFAGCNQHKLMFIDRKPPQTKTFPDFDADAIKTKITSRFATGQASWYGWWGTTGA